MKILFVCKNNRFRSKIAEAYFKKINKNKNIKFSSAGIFRGSPIKKQTKEIIKKFNIIIKGKPRTISTDLLKKQDLIIIVANDVPKSIFNKKYFKKIKIWKIPDSYIVNKKKIEKIIKKIIKKVDKLNRRLKWKQ